MLKPLTMCITTNCGKSLKRWEYQTTWPASSQTCMQVKKQQLEPDMEQGTGSKLGRSTSSCIFSFCLFNFYADSVLFSSVQNISWLFATPWTSACQASLSITNSKSLLKFMSIKLVMPSKHLILCHLLLMPSIFPSIRVFSNESVLHSMWPTYWSFSFSISPWNEYSGLISFRMDWLDLCAAQATLKSLLQHHSSRVSIHSGQDPLIPGLAHFVTLGKSLTLSGPHSFL